MLCTAYEGIVLLIHTACKHQIVLVEFGARPYSLTSFSMLLPFYTGSESLAPYLAIDFGMASFVLLYGPFPYEKPKMLV